MVFHQIARKLAGPERKHRFAVLFFSLLALILLYPVFERGPLSGAFLLFMAIEIPLAAVYSVSDSRRNILIAGALCLPAQLALIELVAGIRILPGARWALAITFILYLFTLYILLRHVLSRDKVTAETLYGAAAVYLLFGVTWALAYSLVEQLQPGSFYFDPARNIDGAIHFFDFIYGSFVTLTTLGYGEMTPVSSAARSLAIVQSVGGVLYIAFLVGRLVGMYSQGATDD